MIYVGLDDTDMPDTPGTNQLARHLVRQLAGRWHGRLITRHQLLEDPRVPCTRKNGCVAIAFEPLASSSLEALVDAITTQMQSWCPVGSDPGLCVTNQVPEEIIVFGRRCQHELVTQPLARDLANQSRILLRGLGGTEDGVIGALAAVGLMNTRDDGRVIYVGNGNIDHYDIAGIQQVSQMASFGVDRVRSLHDGALVTQGRVDVGKRLRPNYRRGEVVLFVSASEQDGAEWYAERLL